MPEITVRPMTEAEFAGWQDDLARAYADEQVQSGNWAPGEALARAREAARRGSHRGGTHPGCCSSSGCGQAGSESGASGSPSSTRRGLRTRAFLYDIEVDEPHRGKGYGRALLTAAEEAARSRGVSALELNVFGGNATSIGLYESAGYIVVQQQMRTRLT
ncbi:GNAT family N-acetyltransferase [Geodermatophilus africanus]|uniref:GNAT family N-acetyltransferase n=1 Tax=Geodermatophilus africanus TaxID=1137993 RepID=UPI001B8D7CDC|nr:GNAT family N-acetyltransferase [Geodermatophilus africanus]